MFQPVLKQQTWRGCLGRFCCRWRRLLPTWSWLHGGDEEDCPRSRHWRPFLDALLQLEHVADANVHFHNMKLKTEENNHQWRLALNRWGCFFDDLLSTCFYAVLTGFSTCFKPIWGSHTPWSCQRNPPWCRRPSPQSTLRGCMLPGTACARWAIEFCIVISQTNFCEGAWTATKKTSTKNNFKVIASELKDDLQKRYEELTPKEDEPYVDDLSSRVLHGSDWTILETTFKSCNQKACNKFLVFDSKSNLLVGLEKNFFLCG